MSRDQLTVRLSIAVQAVSKPRALRQFRRHPSERQHRVPSWRPHDSLRLSRGRAPQPSRSIRTHRNARCEPRRCAAASPFSSRRPDCVVASRSSIRAVFRPRRSKRPQVCRTATAGQRRLLSRTCQGSTPSSAAPSQSREMGGVVARAKAIATWSSPSCASSVIRQRPAATTVHDLQIVDSVPRDPTDQPLSVIATPTHAIRIKRPQRRTDGHRLDAPQRRRP